MPATDLILVVQNEPQVTGERSEQKERQRRSSAPRRAWTLSGEAQTTQNAADRLINGLLCQIAPAAPESTRFARVKARFLPAVHGEVRQGVARFHPKRHTAQDLSGCHGCA